MPQRSWDVDLAGTVRHVTVDYKVLSGFMSIEVDGQRIARGWREWQTVVGGATLSAAYADRLLGARITQRFGTQTYRLALSVDEVEQSRSDELPAPGEVGRRSVRALLVLAYVVSVISFLGQGLLHVAATAAVAGFLCVKIIDRTRWSPAARAAGVAAVSVGWVLLLLVVAALISIVSR